MLSHFSNGKYIHLCLFQWLKPVTLILYINIYHRCHPHPHPHHHLHHHNLGLTSGHDCGAWLWCVALVAAGRSTLPQTYTPSRLWLYLSETFIVDQYSCHLLMKSTISVGAIYRRSIFNSRQFEMRKDEKKNIAHVWGDEICGLSCDISPFIVDLLTIYVENLAI